jgi:ATP-dependent DNA helicase RecQ
MKPNDPAAMSDDEVLRTTFGFASFRPGQREVLAALQRQRAALAVFPTGSGKSLCYQLPALRLPGVTLVISPLIALMKDQIDFLRSRGIAAARLDSSLSAAETEAVNAGLRGGSLKLLYVAPERFNNERFVSLLQQTEISLFAVDEAHCISEWGHNFRPDYLKLAELGRTLKVERVLGLTATATPQVVADICAAFHIPADCAVVTGFYRPNLTMLTSAVAADQRDQALLDRLQGRAGSRPRGSTIVYTTLQKTTERVAAQLAAAGLPARAYHAGLEADQRAAVQEAWMAADDGIVVATIAFGMGIDKAAVRHVYHYNLPKSLESYSQEIGRAGRDGLPATVELFACADDLPILENFAYGDTPTEPALAGLIAELLAAGDDFHVNLIELSNRHDIRPLVLRTALTYLELLGVLRQGTPFYAGYELKPKLDPETIAGKFEGERARFITDLFGQARKGRVWYALDPDAAARALGQPRDRVVRALEYIEAQGWAELRASDVRHRFRRLRADLDQQGLVAELSGRFQARERQEIARVAEVVALVTADRCQVNALVAHFGETRAAPCGHCSHCLTGVAQRLPQAADGPALSAGVDLPALRALAADHRAALALPRQAARFLCGLSSPALSRARLTRHPLFGALEDRRFGEVLAWLEAGAS